MAMIRLLSTDAQPKRLIKCFPRLRTQATHARALGQSDQGIPVRRVDLRVAWRRTTAEVRATEEWVVSANLPCSASARTGPGNEPRDRGR